MANSSTVISLFPTFIFFIVLNLTLICIAIIEDESESIESDPIYIGESESSGTDESDEEIVSHRFYRLAAPMSDFYFNLNANKRKKLNKFK